MSQTGPGRGAGDALSPLCRPGRRLPPWACGGPGTRAPCPVLLAEERPLKTEPPMPCPWPWGWPCTKSAGSPRGASVPEARHAVFFLLPGVPGTRSFCSWRCPHGLPDPGSAAAPGCQVHLRAPVGSGQLLGTEKCPWHKDGFARREAGRPSPAPGGREMGAQLPRGAADLHPSCSVTGLAGLREERGLRSGAHGRGAPCPGSSEVSLRPRQQEGEGNLLMPPRDRASVRQEAGGCSVPR